jgi:hypothetical protein
MTGQNIGYIRVSSAEQNTERQLDGLVMDRTFTDKISGKSTDRPQLQEMLRFVRDGDHLFVHSMDRLARNLIDLHCVEVIMKHRGSAVRTDSASPYISPRELAFRWRCGRSSVDRIARLAGMTRLCLGSGRNGAVRYLVTEVEAYEASRMIAMR